MGVRSARESRVFRLGGLTAAAALCTYGLMGPSEAALDAAWPDPLPPVLAPPAAPASGDCGELDRRMHDLAVPRLAAHLDGFFGRDLLSGLGPGGPPPPARVPVWAGVPSAAGPVRLDGRHALAVGAVEGSSPRRGDDPVRAPQVLLRLVDTSAGGRTVRAAKLTGRHVATLAGNGGVRVVLATAAPVRVVPPAVLETREEALAFHRALLHRYAPTDWLPAREILDARGVVVASRPALACADVHRATGPAGPDLLWVLTIDPSDGLQALERARGRAVLGGADLVYASTDRLYVAGAGPGAGVTSVHAFDLTPRQDTPYLGGGRVSGRLLGPWAVSAHAGWLRLAVTEGAGAASRSSMVVLGEAAGGLRQVGALSGLGRATDIRVVRWEGDSALVVTGPQGRSYGVDLSRPSAPARAGELGPR